MSFKINILNYLGENGIKNKLILPLILIMMEILRISLNLKNKSQKFLNKNNNKNFVNSNQNIPNYFGCSTTSKAI